MSFSCKSGVATSTGANRRKSAAACEVTRQSDTEREQLACFKNLTSGPTLYRVFKIQRAERIPRKPEPLLYAVIIPWLVFVALHPIPRRNVIPLRAVWMTDNGIRNFQGCRRWQCWLVPLYVGKLTRYLVNDWQSEIAVKYTPWPGEYPEPQHFGRLDDLRSDPIFTCTGGVDLVGFDLPQTDNRGQSSTPSLLFNGHLPIKSVFHQAGSSKFYEDRDREHYTRQS